RITKEMAKTEKEIVKSKAKLSSPNFVDKAPANVVEQERERLQDWTKKIEQLKSMLGSLA
ncbi:MAG: hypothetical protein RSB88_08835, partial [Akkermansia sp.]